MARLAAWVAAASPLISSELFPAPATFLDGTFVASQQCALPDVAVVATSVSPGNGGLGVVLATKAEGADAGKKQKVQKSVRDVAIANDILFVCDEVHQSINMYSLKDGSFLTQAKLDGNPTHLASCNGGLFVSAGTKLFWGQLPAQPGAPLALTQVSLMPPPLPPRRTRSGASASTVPRRPFTSRSRLEPARWVLEAALSGLITWINLIPRRFRPLNTMPFLSTTSRTRRSSSSTCRTELWAWKCAGSFMSLRHGLIQLQTLAAKNLAPVRQTIHFSNRSNR